MAAIEAKGLVSDLASNLLDERLHVAKDPTTIITLLKEGLDENGRNLEGLTPLHAIVSRPMDKKGMKFECVMAFLKHANSSSLEISAPTTFEGDTALHIAVKLDDVKCCKCLLAFGADVNAVNEANKTPLDIALEEDRDVPLLNCLVSLGGVPGEFVKVKERKERENIATSVVNIGESEHDGPASPSSPGLSWRKIATIEKTADNAEPIKAGTTEPVKAENSKPVIPKEETKSKKEEVKERLLQSQTLRKIRKQLSTISLTESFRDDVISAIVQLRESAGKGVGSGMHTGLTPVAFSVEGGQWVLSLDGGGIKGLAQLDILMQIETMTGRRITEMFDWIIGTSVGAVLALSLVYANRTLSELRKLFFQLKDDVFSTGTKSGYNSNTNRLEELFQIYLGKDTRLTDKTHPKVLITAVDSKYDDLKLRWFNNFYYGDHEFCNELLWKVARYTSAAPVYFEPLDGYVDGGVRANNPIEYGLTVIHEFLKEQFVDRRQRPPIACVVSIGTGIYPPKKVGDFGVQKYAMFGKHWLNPLGLVSRFENLIMLLCSAIADSVGVAANCRCRCEQQGIAYYRFDPQLSEVIPLSETDDETLCDLVITTQQYIQSQEALFDELLQVMQHRWAFKGGEPSFMPIYRKN